MGPGKLGDTEKAMTHKKTIFILGAVALALVGWVAGSAVLKKAKGNLPCTPLTAVTAQSDPLELYRRLRGCMADKNYKDAAGLMAMANGFMKFDTLRVVDVSAHAVTGVMALSLQRFSTEERTQLLSEIKGLSEDAQQTLCTQAERIGPPAYFPRYMIAHGLATYDRMPGAEALAKDFQPDQAWDTVMRGYLRCGA